MPADRALETTRLMPAVAALRVDEVAAEVVEALSEAGVPSILMKGASTAAWLYGDGSPRAYVDCDLLVAPADHAAAEARLSDLGFEVGVADRDTPGWRLTSHEWFRGDEAIVDLHRTLIGAEAPPARVWAVLSGSQQRMFVGGAEVEVLSLPARAMQIAIHAAQHGTEAERQLEDLRRAVRLTDQATWGEAAALAERIDAVPAFAAGLRLCPEGRELAVRLGLAEGGSREVALRSTSAARGALGLEELARAAGPGKKLALIARNLVPPPRFLRAWSPLARRGRVGLAAAYVWRPLAIALRAGPAAIAWLRAGRRSGPTRPG